MLYFVTLILLIPFVGGIRDALYQSDYRYEFNAGWRWAYNQQRKPEDLSRYLYTKAVRDNFIKGAIAAVEKMKQQEVGNE